MADQFEATLVCEGVRALVAGRKYVLETRGQRTLAAITSIKYRIEDQTGSRLAAKTLSFGESAVVNISTEQAIRFDYAAASTSNEFVLRDKLLGVAVASGQINFVLRRASNIRWQELFVDKASRSVQMQQVPRCVWFTGLSGAGKSTIANLVEKRLFAAGRHTYLLDGDNVRHGLNRDLGFTESNRVENIRRVAEVAKLMVDAGLIVLVGLISPFRNDREMARGMFSQGEFVEVFVDTPLQACEQRDVKGLYRKARSGQLKNFTGIDSPYEAPERAEIHLRTQTTSAGECVDEVFAYIEAV